MVTMAPSSMRIRSLSPSISLFRKVPVRLGGVAQGIDKVALLVALHIDNAVRTVHAHVRGFYRDIDNRPYAAAAEFYCLPPVVAALA